MLGEFPPFIGVGEFTTDRLRYTTDATLLCGGGKHERALRLRNGRQSAILQANGDQ